MIAMYLFNDYFHLHLHNRFHQMSMKHLHVNNLYYDLIAIFTYACVLKINIFNFLYTRSYVFFFRDLITHTFTEDVIQQLHDNILILLCNLEKIFLLAFLTS